MCTDCLYSGFECGSTSHEGQSCWTLSVTHALIYRFIPLPSLSPLSIDSANLAEKHSLLSVLQRSQWGVGWVGSELFVAALRSAVCVLREAPFREAPFRVPLAVLSHAYNFISKGCGAQIMANCFGKNKKINMFFPETVSITQDIPQQYFFNKKQFQWTLLFAIWVNWPIQKWLSE